MNASEKKSIMDSYKGHKKIILVAGARPNFMKIAPIMKEMKKYPDRFQPIFVHTGQHYDNNMSEIFLHDLGLPEKGR